MKKRICYGIVTPLITPTSRHGDLLIQPTRELVRRVLSGGVHGVFVAGTTGEDFCLTREVRRKVTEVVLEETSGAVPVYCGISGNATSTCIDEAQEVAAIGVDAITALPPVAGSYSDDELYEHFASIASAIEIPLVLYGNPNRTGVHLSPDLVARLMDVENIVGIKDSSGDLTLTNEYIRIAQDGFNVLAGKDSLIVQTIMAGGAGAVAATSNIAPELLTRLFALSESGSYEEALKIQFRLLPLRRAFGMGSTSAVMLKRAMAMLGLDVGEAVAPSIKLGQEKERELAEVLGDLGFEPSLSR
jgi:4-hydroxy-tetrahydrodipicolinate synthase